MALSPTQISALHNLADKQAGRDVDWISIADARALTELGLARRTRSGWEITAKGAAFVDAPTGRSNSLTALTPRSHPGEPDRT